MYLLDTDVLIWVLRGRKEIIRKISVLKSELPLSVSVISIAEIYQNIFPSELITTEEYLEKHIILPVDTTIAKLAGFYWQEYVRELKNLSLSDCWIAASANVHDAILVSLNTKHFPMRDIQVINPIG